MPGRVQVQARRQRQHRRIQNVAGVFSTKQTQLNFSESDPKHQNARILADTVKMPGTDGVEESLQLKPDLAGWHFTWVSSTQLLPAWVSYLR
jgi:hypothetical protein